MIDYSTIYRMKKTCRDDAMMRENDQVYKQK